MGTPPKDGIFWHQCEEPECTHTIQFDDEPKCFKHSPDSGSSVVGYSAFEVLESLVVKSQKARHG